MGLLDGLINRWFKTGVSADDADASDPEVLTPARAAIRFVGATVTDVPEKNRTDVEISAGTVADGSVTTAKLADGAVTLAKQANMAGPAAIGRLSGTGVPQLVSIAEAQTATTLPVRTSTGTVRVADATNAQDALAKGQHDTAIAAVAVVTSDHETRLDTAEGEIDALQAAGPTTRTATVDLNAAAAFADMTGGAFTIPVSTTRVYEVRIQVRQPEFTTSGGEATLIDENTHYGRALFAVERDSGTGITVDLQTGSEWSLGYVKVKPVDDGAGGWKLQASAGATGSTTAIDVDILATVIPDGDGLPSTDGSVTWTDLDSSGGASLSDATPAAPTTAGTAGVAATASRGDHAHPRQTTLGVAAGETPSIGNTTGATTIDGSTTTVKSAGDINLRPTGATTDSLKVAIVSTETKITTPASQNLRGSVGGTCIWDGTGRVILSASTASKFDAIQGSTTTVTASTTLGLQAATATHLGTTSQDRLVCRWPADVTLSTDAETTVLAVTVSTSRPLVCRGVILVRDASMNVYSCGFEFTAKNVGGTASLVGAVTETEKNDGGGSIASVATSFSASGATILIRATRPAGVACTATVTELEFA